MAPQEMRYGSFTRSFSLPPDVKHDKAEAGFADGVPHHHDPQGGEGYSQEESP
jgi:hypothetical protein